MKQSTKDAGKKLLKLALVAAAQRGPKLLYKHRRQFVRRGSKLARLSPVMLIGSKLLIKYLERKKIL